jgi:NADPH:quinone reductase
MKAIRIHETGGPEVMHLEEVEQPTPQAGEVLIQIAAAGINYADLGQRQGCAGYLGHPFAGNDGFCERMS